MQILYIVGAYPSPNSGFGGAFAQQFVWALARQGNECSVLCPTSVFSRIHGSYPPTQAIEDAGAGKTVRVYRPRYFSFSSRDLGWTHTGRWTQLTFNMVAACAARALPTRPDVVCGHFLYQAGRAAVTTGARLGVPAIVSVGEGVFWTVAPFGFERARREFERAAGFIAVGSHIRDGLITQLGIPDDKIMVEPNGVDRARFFSIDRDQARARLGLDLSRFLVGFVGNFDDLKGGAELVRATAAMEGVGLLLLGQGPVDLSSDKIVYKGDVRHEEVPVWLNAADIFVLPTREEGSCNAVIEAMACGLPIVTSNGRYMDDIVDSEVAIRVDPTDVQAIRDAILLLKNEPQRRKRMSMACFRKAKPFDINERAYRVSKWMRELVMGHQR